MIVLRGHFKACTPQPKHLICGGDLKFPQFNIRILRLFLGSRRFQKRSLQNVDEHFEIERNAKIIHKTIVKR